MKNGMNGLTVIAMAFVVFNMGALMNWHRFCYVPKYPKRQKNDKNPKRPELIRRKQNLKSLLWWLFYANIFVLIFVITVIEHQGLF